MQQRVISRRQKCRWEKRGKGERGEEADALRAAGPRLTCGPLAAFSWTDRDELRTNGAARALLVHLEDTRSFLNTCTLERGPRVAAADGARLGRHRRRAGTRLSRRPAWRRRPRSRRRPRPRPPVPPPPRLLACGSGTGVGMQAVDSSPAAAVRRRQVRAAPSRQAISTSEPRPDEQATPVAAPVAMELSTTPCATSTASTLAPQAADCANARSAAAACRTRAGAGRVEGARDESWGGAGAARKLAGARAAAAGKAPHHTAAQSWPRAAQRRAWSAEPSRRSTERKSSCTACVAENMTPAREREGVRIRGALHFTVQRHDLAATFRQQAGALLPACMHPRCRVQPSASRH